MKEDMKNSLGLSNDIFWDGVAIGLIGLCVALLLTL